MSSKPLDRRTFIGRIAVTAGGGVAASLLPVSLLQAGEVAACLVTPACPPDQCGDWALDDICNAYPGYAYDFQRIAAPRAPLMAAVADVDRMWMA
jgi:hypothetical protein